MEKEIQISPARLNEKVNTMKEIPESLIRPPAMDRAQSAGTYKRRNFRDEKPSVAFGGY